MTVYIPYKHKDGEELRFCLRAIDKHLTGHEDVILITDKTPDWYRGKIIYHPDVSDRKQLNIISKLFQVKDDKFIMFNDDHILLKPLHINEIKNWYHGTISEAQKKAQGRYYKSVGNTLEHFGDVKYYDIHTPCIFTREQIQRVFGLEWGDKEFVIKTAALYQEDGEEMTDCKINQLLSMGAIEEKIKDRLFFSTGPGGMKTPMINLLNIMFNNKSKFET